MAAESDKNIIFCSVIHCKGNEIENHYYVTFFFFDVRLITSSVTKLIIISNYNVEEETRTLFSHLYLENVFTTFVYFLEFNFYSTERLFFYGVVNLSNDCLDCRSRFINAIT